MSEAFIFYSDDDGRFELRCPKDNNFEAELVKYVPESKWEFSSRTWSFTSDYLLKAYSIAKRYFSNVQLDTETLNFLKSKFEEQEKTSPDNPYAVLYLLDTAPLWLAEKVYKLLIADERSEYLHQDKGGNPIKTGELNDAIDKIRNPKTD